MQLLLKDKPILDIQENGTCRILDFDRLPFALRKENITFIDFIEWASNRTLSIGRSYAKEILNSLRLSQTNRFAVCKACRGLSLEDAYWIRQEGDDKTWKEVNLFHNPFALFVTEISLSGTNIRYTARAEERANIHTPELTTMGASAKGWIRQDGKRKEWIESVGEAVVNSELFTSEHMSLVTFEEFRLFCSYYGMNPYSEAEKMDREFYLKMQIVDYILNNNDRHEQNWGFLMDNETGKLTGFCPLFDHDHAFVSYKDVMSQTAETQLTLRDAAVRAQKELWLNLDKLDVMERPQFLSAEQWDAVLVRKEQLS